MISILKIMGFFFYAGLLICQVASHLFCFSTLFSTPLSLLCVLKPSIQIPTSGLQALNRFSLRLGENFVTIFNKGK